MGWMLLRLLFAALIARLIWKVVGGALSGGPDARARGAKSGVALVRDPVCGTYVEPSRAIRIRAGGTTHYFCSKECQRSFVKTA